MHRVFFLFVFFHFTGDLGKSFKVLTWVRTKVGDPSSILSMAYQSLSSPCFVHTRLEAEVANPAQGLSLLPETTQ